MWKRICISGAASTLSLLAIAAVLAADVTAPKRRYATEDLKIIGVKAADDGKLVIKFETLAETLYFCPGVKVAMKDDGTQLRFVRCPINETCDVDYEAKAGVLTVPSEGKPLFVADGEKRVKIWPRE